MGLFVIIFSIAVVIIQATSMLLGRDANKWSFWLLESSPNITHIPDIDLIFKAINDDYKSYNNNMPYFAYKVHGQISNLIPSQLIVFSIITLSKL